MNTKRLAYLLFGAVCLATACSSTDTSENATEGSGGHKSHETTSSAPDSGQGPGPSTGATIDAAVTSSTTTGSSDPNAELRARCVAKINALRATKGRAAYAPWDAGSCADAQATSDEQNSSPHQAWSMHAGVCDGNGQNECEGQGADIEGCLDQMWGEKDQPNCAGCDACAGAYNPSCPNCDFSGAAGQVCGHYVNLSAEYFTQVVCGFSSLGGWDVMNFQ